MVEMTKLDLIICLSTAFGSGFLIGCIFAWEFKKENKVCLIINPDCPKPNFVDGKAIVYKVVDSQKINEQNRLISPFEGSTYEIGIMKGSNRLRVVLYDYEIKTCRVEFGLHVFNDLESAKKWLKKIKSNSAYFHYEGLTILKCEVLEEDLVACGGWDSMSLEYKCSVFMKVLPLEEINHEA